MTRRRERVLEWMREARADDNPAAPAATVILVRDADGGVETLMVRKDSEVAFGGMWVFPGGRIEDEDRRPGDDDLLAARRAASREAVEEVGVALDEDSFEWISFWVSPSQTPKRFATWFFVAPAPDDHVVTIDDAEIRDHRWLGPADALRLHREAEIELAPPTWVTLRWLADHEAVAPLLRAARDREPERFAARLARTESGGVLLWEGDAGYESGDPRRPGPRHRMVISEDGWSYERS